MNILPWHIIKYQSRSSMKYRNSLWLAIDQGSNVHIPFRAGPHIRPIRHFMVCCTGEPCH